MNIFSAYAFPLLLHGVAPLLLIVGLYYRRWRYVIFSLAAFCLTYAVAGTKSSLLLVPLIGFAVFLGKRPNCHAGAWILVGLTATTALSRYTFLQYGDVWFSAIVTGRFLIGPARNAYDYFSFFSTYPFFYCSDVNGVASLLDYYGFVSPYTTTKSFVLGAWRFDNPLTNMNTNAWVNAYGDGGLWGVLLLCIVVGLFFRILDKRGEIRGDAIMIAMTLLYGHLLTESSLPGLILGGLDYQHPDIMGLYTKGSQAFDLKFPPFFGQVAKLINC